MNDDRIDDLVRDAERRAWDDALADASADASADEVTAARDREAVLARIRSAPAARRMPWWRTAAPIAVAASLVGMFILRDQLMPVDDAALEAEQTLDLLEESRQRKSSATARETPDAADSPPPTPVAALGRASSAAERTDADESRLTLVDDVAFRVDAALALLGPVEEPEALQSAVRDSLIEVLRELRPRVQDTTRARRIDAWIAPRE